MGKTSSPLDILKNILKDIANVQNIIDDSKELENTCVKVNFDDADEVEKIIKATKAIVDNLKAEAIKIETYFDNNCKSWKNNVLNCDTNIESSINTNPNLCDTGNGEIENRESSEIEGTVTNHIENEHEQNGGSITPSIENSAIVDKDINENSSAETIDKDQHQNLENVGKDHNENSKDNDECDESIEPAEEPKVFLKCVDINKLINPDILPHLKSPKPLDNDDDDVLIISDSDDDVPPATGKRRNKSRKSTTKTPSNLNSDRTLKNECFDTSRRLRRHVASKENKSISSTDKKKNSRKSSRISEVRQSSSDSDVRLVTAKKSIKIQYKRKLKQADRCLSDTNSASECELQSSKTTARVKKPVKLTKTEKLILNRENDKKFSYKSYVSLERVPCEKLKENYLRQKEIDEIKRLTDLKTLKKRRRRSNEEKNHDSSTDSNKNKSKKQRKSSKNSSTSSDTDVSINETVISKLADVDPKNVSENEQTMTRNAMSAILDGINSESEKGDMSNDENKKDDETSKKNHKEDNSKKNKSQNETNSSGSDTDIEKKKLNKNSKSDSGNEAAKSGSSSTSSSQKKSKWRKDRLLTDKLSDTDSEDEFEKFKKQSEQGKSDAKARFCKKKNKKVIDSDSDSNRKSSGDDKESENKKSSSSSSSSDSEKEVQEKDENKKRRRIKKINDSSDEDGDKSTRKTIRKVIGHDSLTEATKQAEKDERERKARILERQKKYNQIFDKPEDATLDKVVLDFNEDTKEEILSVNTDLVKKLKPHQGKGIQFMWDACYESVERAKNTEGSGCILAHCMGLGKTLQVIALTHTLITNDEIIDVKKVLVVCPLSTVLNWVAEYKKWLDDMDGPEIDVYELVSSKQNGREYVVDDWHRTGGVLIIGYDMFRNLTNPNNKRLRKKARDSFKRGFVDPGPDLVICDEGHLLKNEKTHLSIAMNRIHTVRRIVLTGTPMQNNLKEYYCMVQFVKPNLLGTYKEYINRFVNPITNGQYTDSTDHDINVMRKRSHVLHKMLDGIVQRKDYAVLKPFLPPKYEYVLFLSLSETQIKLYQHYKENYSQRPLENKLKSSFLFTDFQEFQRICTHPRVLLLKSQELKNKFVSDEEDEDSEGSLKDFIDDDESEAKSTSSSSNNCDSDASTKSNSKSKKKEGPHKRMTRNSAAASGIDVDEIINSNDTGGGEWWRQYCDGEELDNIEHSSKLYLLFQILQECELMGDKLLVFSQSLYSLTIIEYFLAKIDEATQQGDNSKVSGFSGSWTLGLDYFRLDGSSSCDNRAAWCKNFNNTDNPRARLFLISTRAGGLGINLVGANRVIIFDASWNPSHDTQSIYRVYRFGQTKPCYIYRFVISGAMEMKIYERQVTKQAISKRVIDEQQIDRHYNQNDLAELYKFDPRPTINETPLLPKDVLLAELLQKEKDRIHKYHEHQSLLENKRDEELNEDERKAAWEEFESEKTARVASNSSMGWIKNLPISSITIALTSIVQKDNPTWTEIQVKSVIPLILQQLREQVESGEMVLFQRVVAEMRQMQVVQQRKYQEYIRQQQQQQHQMKLLQQHLRNQMMPQMGMRFPNNPNEIVELND